MHLVALNHTSPPPPPDLDVLLLKLAHNFVPDIDTKHCSVEVSCNTGPVQLCPSMAKILANMSLINSFELTIHCTL